jgi:2-succinyl-5-enolpyruvyl-6-hydroxy-3-cyclohexene-1-carboxylate synthase
MKTASENINTLWCDLAIEELVRNGIKYFCISPGSRSSPLTVAVARHEDTQSIVCYDERGASFHALGYARATQRPAAIITTSGSAVANCFPAVVEASMDRVPLLVLSADRPPELRHTGANQTIHQPGIFGNYVRFHFDMPCPDEKIPPQMILTTVDQAVYRASSSPKGPVHINFMFREPLAPEPLKVAEAYTANLNKWVASHQPYTCYSTSSIQANPQTINEMANMINKARHGLMVVGRLNSRHDQQEVARLADKLNWPVFADVASGLRLGYPSAHLIPYFDQLLLSERFRREFRPHVVLHMGEVPTSKRFLQFITDGFNGDYIVIENHPDRLDPAHMVTWRVETDISYLCRELSAMVETNTDQEFVDGLRKKSDKAAEIIEEYSQKTTGISEPSVARWISQNIPAGTGLFLASSMAIREMDMYACHNGPVAVIGTNRGTSGIDGTIASAAGLAAGINKPVTLVMGDLAFIHDLSSLSLLDRISQSLIIVLINNRGGGIFSFLPISGFQDVFESFFAVPHDLTFQHAARLFNMDYHTPCDRQAFIESYKAAIKGKRHTIIEVQTSREENFRFHVRLQKKIINAIEDARQT